MHEPKNAAKQRALTFRTELKQREEELDRTRREIHAARVQKSATEEQLEALGEMVRLQQLHVIQLSGLAHAYEQIAAGRRVYV